MFSFGRIANDMVGIRSRVCSEPGSEDEGAVPTDIKALLSGCLAEDPAARPDMGSVVDVLDELCTTIRESTAEWTVFETTPETPVSDEYAFLFDSSLT